MWPISRARGPPARPSNVATTVSPSRPAGSGRDSTVAPSSVRKAATQRPDLVDAVARVAAAVDVDEVLEVGEVDRQVGADRGRAARRVRRPTGAAGCTVEAVMERSLGRWHLAILPGPCDWSRPACSRARTSTGSSRWSSSRSPSGGGARGTASAIRGATPWSTWGPTSRRATGPTRSPRPSPGSGACGPTMARVAAASRSIARPTPGHWIVTFPWIGAERAQTHERGGARARRARRLAVADGPADRRPGAHAGALDRAHRGGPDDARPSGSATPTGASRSCRSPAPTARAP